MEPYGILEDAISYDLKESQHTGSRRRHWHRGRHQALSYFLKDTGSDSSQNQILSATKAMRVRFATKPPGKQRSTYLPIGCIGNSMPDHRRRSFSLRRRPLFLNEHRSRQRTLWILHSILIFLPIPTGRKSKLPGPRIRRGRAILIHVPPPLGRTDAQLHVNSGPPPSFAAYVFIYSVHFPSDPYKQMAQIQMSYRTNWISGSFELVPSYSPSLARSCLAVPLACSLLITCMHNKSRN